MIEPITLKMTQGLFKMMGKKKTLGLFLFVVLATSLFVATITAEEDEDIKLFGFELEKILVLINAWISVFLFVLAFVAYRRYGRKRLLYVSLAFFLFAIKNFFASSELFFPETSWIDPIVVALEFAVLLSFFYGVLKK